MPKFEFDRTVIQSRKIEISEQAYEEVKKLLRQMKKIDAIKKVREDTEMGLKEAKEFVDHLIRLKVHKQEVTAKVELFKDPETEIFSARLVELDGKPMSFWDIKFIPCFAEGKSGHKALKILAKKWKDAGFLD